MEFPGSPGDRRRHLFRLHSLFAESMQSFSIRHFYQAKNCHAHRLNTLDPEADQFSADTLALRLPWRSTHRGNMQVVLATDFLTY